VIRFAAGRGGTGRSLIAANVSIYLAQTGKRVVAVDADPAGRPAASTAGRAASTRGYGSCARPRRRFQRSW